MDLIIQNVVINISLLALALGFLLALFKFSYDPADPTILFTLKSVYTTEKLAFVLQMRGLFLYIFRHRLEKGKCVCSCMSVYAFHMQYI